jgi:hypothetical protein
MVVEGNQGGSSEENKEKKSKEHDSGDIYTVPLGKIQGAGFELPQPAQLVVASVLSAPALIQGPSSDLL